MLLAWGAWRRAGTEPPDDRATAVSGERFLAALALSLSAVAALSIVAQWLTTGFIAPCLE
jgi:hypothetical protein